MTLDFREFDRALKDYAWERGKTSDDIVARKARDICLQSVAQTIKAEESKIRSTYSNTVYQELTRRKAGKFKGMLKGGKMRVADVSKNFAVRIIIWQYQKRGESVPSQEQIEKEAIKLIAKRCKAAAYLRAGWLFAADRLAELKPGLSGVGGRKFGKPKGTAAILALGDNAEVMIANETASVSHQRDASSKAPQPGHSSARMVTLITDGLRRGIATATADMLDYIAKRHQRAADKFNAK